MKVISCNTNGRMRQALERQASTLLELKPDILALQEVTLKSYDGWCEKLDDAGFSVVSSVELMAHPYPPGPYLDPPFPPGRGREIKRKYFSLTAARHPIVMLPGLSFDEPEEERYAFPEKFVAARVTVDGREIDVHNAHLPPGASRGFVKAHAFEAIRRRVDQDGDKPRLLCGDFNAPWDENADGPVPKRRRDWGEELNLRWSEAESGVISNPELRDVYRDVHDRQADLPVSHVTRSKPHRYDYIFASEDFRTEECRYLVDWLERDERNRRLSDHAPVEAVLWLRG